MVLFCWEVSYLYVRDLAGKEYPIQVTTTKSLDLNGNQFISFMILPTKVNNLFINEISEMWEVVDENDVSYKIIYFKKKGEGKRLSVNIKAIPLFIDKFNSERIYEEYNEHMTANECFSIIFDGTGYDFVLVDAFSAIQWEGFGAGEARLELFKKALNRYGAEFRLHGNTVYLERHVGRDTNFMFRHRLNASNIVQEIDASSLYTYAKGYGDYEDGEENEGGGWQNAKLIREYTSPLAEIIGIRHAPPIKDGRIKDLETMDAKLIELVDNSLKISVSADIHLLRKQGYALAQPELGDRVFLIDERIGLNTEVRVVDISITRNWKGEVIDLKLTFGTPGLVKRYQSNLKTSIQNITDVMEGRKKLPLTALDNAVIQATRDLQNVLTELVTPPNGGLMAVDKQDPNKIVVFNSAGIGISDDGGATFKTAMTGSGIVADVITAGTLRGITVISDDGEGNTIVIESGSLRSMSGGKKMIDIHDYHIRFFDPNSETSVGTLSSARRLNEQDIGIALIGDADFLQLGRRTGPTTHKTVADFCFKTRRAWIYGAESSDDDGRLYLRATPHDHRPAVMILDYDENSTHWAGVYVYTGRDDKSSTDINIRSGFELWHYKDLGTGTPIQLIKIDTASTGATYAGIYTDEAWLPQASKLKYKNGYYSNALGIQIDNELSNLRGTLDGNALLYLDIWNFNVNPNQRYTTGRYTLTQPENVFAVFVQPMGSNSIYFNARAYNITNSGFDVYVAKNDASDNPSATQIQLQIMIIYEPRA